MGFSFINAAPDHCQPFAPSLGDPPVVLFLSCIYNAAFLFLPSFPKGALPRHNWIYSPFWLLDSGQGSGSIRTGANQSHGTSRDSIYSRQASALALWQLSNSRVEDAGILSWLGRYPPTRFALVHTSQTIHSSGPSSTFPRRVRSCAYLCSNQDEDFSKPCPRFTLPGRINLLMKSADLFLFLQVRTVEGYSSICGCHPSINSAVFKVLLVGQAIWQVVFLLLCPSFARSNRILPQIS
ncbi:uncharacterized protein BO87DRAFT_3949 [Aspergillus neoniger CBS 115656]|uniref:Uncharacterized protein n=1 Tax=Aspergillus neoniger (strain CBS 115656) TaxID=1448310 RepID=A0A318Z044_ASPNB|nr:hypothetical protein BO87DRAFT_3949 [Aspergillus neoniger CBS 115656]PYH39627.1 hypothetical protein BO87DRAFT_3949 [Aspergillus neoniger CBS 115656]